MAMWYDAVCHIKYLDLDYMLSPSSEYGDDGHLSAMDTYVRDS